MPLVTMALLKAAARFERQSNQFYRDLGNFKADEKYKLMMQVARKLRGARPGLAILAIADVLGFSYTNRIDDRFDHRHWECQHCRQSPPTPGHKATTPIINLNVESVCWLCNMPRGFSHPQFSHSHSFLRPCPCSCAVCEDHRERERKRSKTRLKVLKKRLDKQKPGGNQPKPAPIGA